MMKDVRPLVRIFQGQLRGVIEKSINGKRYAAFKGIPYAKPPIGKLRFKDPIPIEPWSYVKEASKFGLNCAQHDPITRTMVGGDDCLYLNVYTPSDETSQSSSKPVMFWIHGGLFAYGSGDDTFYGPDYIIEKDVILVTINYRLNVLGFLNLEDEETTGNQGLKDQVLALKWVQQNIANFGGDPKNVTIFGESAGGSCVHYLTISPMAEVYIIRKVVWQHDEYVLRLVPSSVIATGHQRTFELSRKLRAQPNLTAPALYSDVDMLILSLHPLTANNYEFCGLIK